MIYFVRRAYLADPPLRGIREIEWPLERTLIRVPNVVGASVFADLDGDSLKGIVIEVAIEASDEPAASKHGRAAIRSSLRRVGVSPTVLRLADGLTSEAPPSSR